MLPIGWFSTGRDQAACDLLETVMRECEAGRLGCRLSFVFSNRAPGESEASDAFQACVRRFGLPLLTLSSAAFDPALWEEGRRNPEARRRWRLAYDAAVEDLIRPYAAEVIVLAGYMLVLGAELCRRRPFLNLHPALPHGPAGTWQEVVWQLLLEEAEAAGAMVHLVTPELDRGPAVSYFSFPLRGPDWDELWRDWRQRRAAVEKVLAARGRGFTPGPEERLFWAVRREEARRELPLLVHTLDLVARGEVRVGAGEVRDREGRVLTDGYCLNAAVEAWLARAGG